jgi:hypothetical protein
MTAGVVPDATLEMFRTRAAVSTVRIASFRRISTTSATLATSGWPS